MAENYLIHYGILGMKWGQRRYQNPDGSLTTAGRERYGVGKPESRIRVILGGAKKAVVKTKETAEKVVENVNQAKIDKIIRSGNASEVLKYQDKLSSQELNEALTRVRNVSALSAIMDQDMKRLAEYTKDKGIIGKARKALELSLNAVNTVNKIVEAKKTIDGWRNKKDDVMDMKPEELKKKIQSGDLSIKELEKTSKGFNFYNSIVNPKPKTNQTPAPKPDPNLKPEGGKPDTTTNPQPASTTTETGSGKESKPKSSFTVSNNRSQLISNEREKEISAENIKAFWNKERTGSSTFDEYVSTYKAHDDDIKPVWDTYLDSEYNKPSWFDELMNL